MEPVEFLFKTRLIEGVGAVGHFQSNICPVLWLQRSPAGVAQGTKRIFIIGWDPVVSGAILDKLSP